MILEAWTALLLGSLIFLGLVSIVGAGNLMALRRLTDYGRAAPAGPAPMVSVLVPARDEAPNIEACVRSLLAQTLAPLEVIVLDDASRDGTGAILARLAQTDARLRVLSGQPLPAGWLGKHWACHQLAQTARGDLLLFTDADTRHAPGALAAAVAVLYTEDADLVTALPRQEVITLGERLIVPILGWSLFCFLPVGLAHRLQWPPLSASIGQFMLMRRAAYERAGGHAAVRAHATDDLALGRRLMAAGGRWRLVDAGALVRCRMYHGFGEAVAGLSKNLYAAFDYRAGLFVPIWLWVGTAFVAPVLTLLLAALGLPLPGPALALAAAATVMAAGLWMVFAWRFGLPLSLPLGYPASVLLAVIIALRSLVLTLTGRATWKGRSIP